MEPEISISSVVSAYICPVRFYLEKDKKMWESGQYAVCKQLSYHLGGDIDEAVVWGEILDVCESIDPTLREYLHQCVVACRNTQKWRNTSSTDTSVKSKKYRIHGIVDKIFPYKPFFSIVKASKAPLLGIYSTDRLRITACTVCLHEMIGDHVGGGSVEYIVSGISRYHEVQPLDKRRFISALHQARKVINGEIPERPVKAPCETCYLKNSCNPGGSRLSDLF